MRPKRKLFTLAALDANGYLTTTEGTGAGPWTTFLAQPADGCSHPATINSAADLSGITFTITGTDAEGRTISEALVGPTAAATVTSVKYYATVTSLVASSTVGANTFQMGWTALARTPIYPVDAYAHGGPVVAVDIGGTVTYTGKATNGDVYSIASDTLFFDTITGMDAKTVDSTGSPVGGCTGVRIDVASHTSGTLAVTHSQERR